MDDRKGVRGLSRCHSSLSVVQQNGLPAASDKLRNKKELHLDRKKISQQKEKKI